MNNALNMLIVADDLTGAMDTAVNTKLLTASTIVRWKAVQGTVDGICVVDTESRNMTAQKATDKTRELILPILKANNYSVVYKKIDSTMRGNIIAELRVLMEEYKPHMIIVAPAFPAVGRTIIDGMCYVNGVLLRNTEFARDPLAPAYTGRIPDWLREELDIEVYHHTIHEITPETVLLNGMHTFDSETDFHLQSIVKKIPPMGERRILLVGSAALATEFFALHSTMKKPVLAFVGSVGQQTVEQINYAQMHGVKVIKLPLTELYRSGNIESIIKEAQEALRLGTDVILTAAQSREDYYAALQYEEDNNLAKGTLSHFIKELMGCLSKRIVPQTELSGIFITGGDTAISVLHSLEADGAEIQFEVIKGFVCSALQDGLSPGLKAITKAGAFGQETDLYMCIQRLKEE